MARARSHLNRCPPWKLANADRNGVSAHSGAPAAASGPAGQEHRCQKSPIPIPADYWISCHTVSAPRARIVASPDGNRAISLVAIYTVHGVGPAFV